jgi:hypothetical protein
VSDESRQVETVLDQFGLKHLYSRNRRFSDSGTRAACEVQWSSPYETKIAAALPGCCEFATGIIFAGSENRTCSAAQWIFCPARVFKDPTVYQTCPVRMKRISEKST